MIKMFLFLLRKQRYTFLEVFKDKLDYLEESTAGECYPSEDYKRGYLQAIEEMRGMLEEMKGGKNGSSN